MNLGPFVVAPCVPFWLRLCRVRLIDETIRACCPGCLERVKVPPGYIYLVRLMLAEPCEQAFWDAASACLEAVE